MAETKEVLAAKITDPKTTIDEAVAAFQQYVKSFFKGFLGYNPIDASKSLAPAMKQNGLADRAVKIFVKGGAEPYRVMDVLQAVGASDEQIRRGFYLLDYSAKDIGLIMNLHLATSTSEPGRKNDQENAADNIGKNKGLTPDDRLQLFQEYGQKYFPGFTIGFGQQKTVRRYDPASHKYERRQVSTGKIISPIFQAPPQLKSAAESIAGKMTVHGLVPEAVELFVRSGLSSEEAEKILKYVGATDEELSTQAKS